MANNKTTNKGGRPRIHNEKMVKTTLVISEELLEKTEFTTRVYAGGRSEYISKLIEQDLEQNSFEYDVIRKILPQ